MIPAVSAEVLFLLILAGVLVLLVWRNAPPDLVFPGALVVVLLAGLASPVVVLAGFANEGLLTVAALFVVASGIRETGALAGVLGAFRGAPGSVVGAQVRVVAPVALFSGFLNNTPIVAAFVPAVSDWAKRFGISASKVMIPLSYAAILGGVCTLIGTSTNLVLSGLYAEVFGVGLGLFSPAPVGLIVLAAGLAYVLGVSRFLLPDRGSVTSALENVREYTMEMVVPAGSGLVGRSVAEAGLRHLDGLFLAEIVRAGRVLAAVDSSEVLQAGDQLVFTGVVEAVADLQRIEGLQPATEQVFKLDEPRHRRQLVEAVVAPGNALNGLSVRQGEFRNRYGAVILAVCRNGERLRGKVGDVRLRTGDVLLLEAPRSFEKRFRSSTEFLLVSGLGVVPAVNSGKAWIAWAVLVGMVGLAASGVLSMFLASWLAAGVMIASGCVSASEARRSVDWSVLVTIGASLGLGGALLESGVAGLWIERVMGWVSVGGAAVGADGAMRGAALGADGAFVALVVVYLLTWALTEVVTNNAAAALLFPVAVAVAESLGVSPLPFVMAILFAASASFSTPIGYQTNLMVLGPGGYRFSDFLRVGLPLNLLVGSIALAAIPVFYPF